MSDNTDYKFKVKESHYETMNVEWEIANFFTNGSVTDISPKFSFANSKWTLHVLRRDPRSVSLQLSNELKLNEPRENWKCKFGLKNMDGDVLHFVEGPVSLILTIPTQYISRLRHSGAFSNNLTILCTLQRIYHFGEPSSSREHAPLKLISK